MVRRNINSAFGGLPIGARYIYEKLIADQNIGDARFFASDTISEPIIIEITGKAVFESSFTELRDKKIDFNCKPGSCYTVLSELTASDLYLRIKNFYCDILDNCLGKTTSEQQDYVFRFNKPNSMIPWPSGHIEKSEEYIRSLPESSVDANLKDLAMQIISGILEYAYHAKDESGVKMHQYAKALLKKL
jgi:hypothetical protein